MKRYKKQLILLTILFVGIGLAFWITRSPLFALEKKAQGTFQILSNGKVMVDGQEFSSMQMYLQSDYFKVNKKRCLVKHRPSGMVSNSARLASMNDCSLSKTVIKSEYWPSKIYVIPIVFHVISKSDGTGNISDQQIDDQIAVLNEDYRAISGTLGEKGFDTMIRFKKAGITRTVNDKWFEDQNEYEYKSELGWDQEKYLNIYVNSASGYLGYSYLPQEDAGDIYDGVVLLYDAIGGRDFGYSPYDQGRTLVHEIGHYLGLLHTFEGYGCYEGYEAGDLIEDTVKENDEVYGCSVYKNGCDTYGNIHNYMNYTDDLCMEEFTSEQANRLVCSLVNYRPNLYTTQSNLTGITVTSPNGSEKWTVGSSHSITWKTTGKVANVMIDYSIDNGSTWKKIVSSITNTGYYSWIVPQTPSTSCRVRVKNISSSVPSDMSDSVFTIAPNIPPIISLSTNRKNFASVINGSQTPYQKVQVFNTGGGTLEWTASESLSWLSCTPLSGTENDYLTLSVNPDDLTPGTYSGNVTISAADASNSPQQLTVYLTVLDQDQEQPPFGEFSTPIAGSTLAGSIPITGWVLDDIDIQSVKIYNDQTYIGDAIMVEGARPDVETVFPSYPMNDRAGFGYMLLSYALPNSGNGTYTITVKATDSSAHEVTLGTKSITIDNVNSPLPFGAIDTPTQGGIASGENFINWGWVLTPYPQTIPEDGSTIDVIIDGVRAGHPVYNIYRPDIEYFFPGYMNSGGAAGYFYFNTNPFQNGLHTIAWVVTDNNGVTSGIGSRYFTIQNSKNLSHFPSIISSANLPPIDNKSPVSVKKGFGSTNPVSTVLPDQDGTITIKIHELDPLEIWLNPNANDGVDKFSNSGKNDFQSFSVVETIPVGSTFNKSNGTFSWLPGPGFIGNYSFTFISNITNKRIPVRVTILPRESSTPIK